MKIKVVNTPPLNELKADGSDAIAIAKAAGFSITQEELNAVAGGRQKLTDADLKMFMPRLAVVRFTCFNYSSDNIILIVDLNL